MGRKPTGRLRGRPRIKWDEKQYEDFKRLCAMHCTQDEVCGWFDIGDEVLNRLLKEKWGANFPELFRQFSAKGKVSIRHGLYQAATSTDPKKYDFRAAKWLSTQHLGMSEKIAQKIEVEERRVVNIDLSWADEDPGDRSQGEDAQKNPTSKKV